MKHYKKTRIYFPFKTRKLGVFLCFAGVLLIGLKYIEIPFLVKLWFLPHVPLWCVNLSWFLVLAGLLLQLSDT